MAQLPRDCKTKLPQQRRFPPPWSIEQQDACFCMRDDNGQQLAYVYFEMSRGDGRLRFLQGGHVEKCKTGTTLECVTPWASIRDCLRCG